MSFGCTGDQEPVDDPPKSQSAAGEKFADPFSDIAEQKTV